jgi:RNA recognition motif-containing protein
MKELGTGRSRGFGFVSYEDRVSAATAVKKMQGYKILGKRLKVEFKKGEGESSVEDGVPPADADDGGNTKKSYPDDERLIGYLRAISAKSAVESLKEKEGGPDDEDLPDAAHESELAGDLPNDD